MIPVHQTVSGRQGNCFAAALATLLNLDISEVPDTTRCDLNDAAWWDLFTAWLEERGISALLIDQTYPPPRHPTGFGIGLVPGEIEGRNHAVVTQGQRVIFDPSGKDPASYDGQLKLILLLVPNDPAALILVPKLGRVVKAACEVRKTYLDACGNLKSWGPVNDATEDLIDHLDELGPRLARIVKDDELKPIPPPASRLPRWFLALGSWLIERRTA